MSNSYIESDINKVAEDIKRGKSAILIQSCNNFIVADTAGGSYRTISDPKNETAIIRAPIRMLNNNPESTPNNNLVKQSDFRWKFKRKKSG